MKIGTNIGDGLTAPMGLSRGWYSSDDDRLAAGFFTELELAIQGFLLVRSHCLATGHISLNRSSNTQQNYEHKGCILQRAITIVHQLLHNSGINYPLAYTIDLER